MLDKRVLWVVASAMVFFISSMAFAFKAYEIQKGVVELRAQNDMGIIIDSVSQRYVGKSKKKWTYFCVKEKVPSRSQSKPKCFYGEASLFNNVKKGDEVSSIEYSLKNRIYNNRGLIEVGSQRYFYPAHVLYSAQ